MPTISGTVYDDAGATAAGRIVRAYRRDTGALLGSTVTSDGLPIAGDTHYANVSLLLHCDGADNSTVFADSSAAPKTVTAYGNAKISTAQSKFGGASAYFVGGGGRLSTTDGAAFDFGGGNFTIEFWLRPTAVSSWAAYVGKRDSGAFYSPFVIQRSGSASVIKFMAAFVAGTWGVSIEAPHPATNEWSHVAFVRDGSVFKAFLNGVQAGSANAGTSALLKNSSPLNIGAEGDNASGFVGFIDDLRITKGVARYTANFTPHTAPHYDAAEFPAAPAGSYGITTAYTGEVQRIVLDDDAGDLYNDLIDRVIVE